MGGRRLVLWVQQSTILSLFDTSCLIITCQFQFSEPLERDYTDSRGEDQCVLTRPVIFLVRWSMGILIFPEEMCKNLCRWMKNIYSHHQNLYQLCQLRPKTNDSIWDPGSELMNKLVYISWMGENSSQRNEDLTPMLLKSHYNTPNLFYCTVSRLSVTYNQ